MRKIYDFWKVIDSFGLLLLFITFGEVGRLVLREGSYEKSELACNKMWGTLWGSTPKAKGCGSAIVGGLMSAN